MDFRFGLADCVKILKNIFLNQEAETRVKT